MLRSTDHVFIYDLHARVYLFPVLSKEFVVEMGKNSQKKVV